MINKQNQFSRYFSRYFLSHQLRRSNRISPRPLFPNIIRTTQTQIKTLRRLYLRNNSISSLPEEIADLVNLELLDVGGNQIASLPDEIGIA